MKTLDETIAHFSSVMAQPRLTLYASVDSSCIETALAHLNLILARPHDPVRGAAKQGLEIDRLNKVTAELAAINKALRGELVELRERWESPMANVRRIARKFRERVGALEATNAALCDTVAELTESKKALEAANAVNASLSEAVTEISLAKVASVAELERTLAATGARALALESALQRVVDDVLNAERALSVSPNPGRSYCWDSIANAVALLGRHPHTSLSWYTSNADHEREKFLRGLSNCAFDEPFLRSREQYTLNKSDVIRKYAEGKYAAMSWKTRAAEYERHILGCLDAVEKWAVTGMDSVDENRALGLIIVRIRNAARFINKKRAEQVRT